MTPEEFAKAMHKLTIDYEGDEEWMHSCMDDLMCDVLNDLGYQEGVAIFEETPKWYA